ncbi:MarR family winged helix-turn-helix transcriptional regulator [Streptomyces sp. NPDC051546]|uniref:MarR family winged helix-turn-helix transcriptional regulator n=1 Tax=Streptomyces sp. NPDC051546 TaxID=3365655 RepID=UPI0037A9095B
MDRAGPEDRLSVTAREVAQAATGLVDLWARTSRAGSPRLSVLQLRALTATRHRPGISLTRLAEEVGAQAPAASRLCDRLEAAGLLHRRRSADDRREVGLVLTRHGQETIDELHERRSQALRQVLGDMPADRRQCLLEGLRAFAEAADTASGAPSG